MALININMQSISTSNPVRVFIVNKYEYELEQTKNLLNLYQYSQSSESSISS